MRRRRTYSDLGYTVFRVRHVLPNDMVKLIDEWAEKQNMPRGTAVDALLAQYLGVMEVRARGGDPDALALYPDLAPVPAS